MKKEYGILTFKTKSGESRIIIVKGPPIPEPFYRQIAGMAFHLIKEREEFPSDFREVMAGFLEDEGYKIIEPRYYDTFKVW